MTKSFLVCGAALLTVAVTWFGRPVACADDAAADPVLSKHGLKLAGTLAVANEEAEIKTKLAEARQISKQLSRSLTQQKLTMSPGELAQTVKNVTNQVNQLKTELNAVNQQMSQIPRSSGYGNRYARYGGGFMNNNVSMMYAQLLAYRNQLQMEINQESYFLNQLKTQPPDPKQREKIDSEVRDHREAYHQALVDLRGLVDAATAKYDAAAKDEEVKKALIVLGKRMREKPKLGPSHEFHTNVKLLEKLEAAESRGETEQSPAKTSKRSRSGSRTRRSAKGAASATGDPGGSR